MQTVLWWHLHQPDYREPDGKTAGLPWVRMHALRAYTDLCAVAQKTGLAGMTINIVPSLADQLDDIANDRCEDRHHALARRVVEGDDSALAAAFLVHASPTPRPITSLPRFDELRQKAKIDGVVPTADEVTDAIALFHLSWVGFTLGERPEVAKMLKRGRGFTRDDVAELLKLSRDASAEVLDRFRKARHENLIHLTTTPYFHPILPLVIDGEVAKEATSDKGAPVFRARPDAKAQVERAAERHEELFGERPKAIWPAEGALSEDAAHVIAEAGFEVAASDEELLRHSLQAHDAHDVHLHPWRHESSGLHLLFRDRALSDDWGFVYRDLHPNDAAKAFVKGVHERKRRGGTICPVILDGENPFEFYPAAGREHLYAFAERAKKELELVSPVEAATRSPQKLKRLRTGSWIHASLDIWAGDAEDRRAWALLHAVRLEIDLDKLAESDRAKAEHHLFAAEGSDWFWWYGPEFDIPDAPAFDALFRGHLKAAMAFANRETTDDSKTADVSSAEVHARREGILAALERPVFLAKKATRGRRCAPWPIDGLFPKDQRKLTFLERQNALHVAADEDGGAMHKGASVIEDVWLRANNEAVAIAFAARGDVETVTTVVRGELKSAGAETKASEAQRTYASDDVRLQKEDGRVFGQAVIAWSELKVSEGEPVRIHVRAKAGAAEEELPASGVVVTRPSRDQFEA